MKTVSGLIFSNIHDKNLPEFTQLRTMASVPFGGRYRFIDFALSNMVNADIFNIGIITHHNYQSLMDHLGNGKDWDLARRSGGIKLIPPYVTSYENYAGNKLYENRMEALLSATTFVRRCESDYIVLSDCDIIANVNMRSIIKDTIDRDLDATIVTYPIDPEILKVKRELYHIETNRQGIVTGITKDFPGKKKFHANTNILVFRRSVLEVLLRDAVAQNYKLFYHEMMKNALTKYKVGEYVFTGYMRQISSMEEYFTDSMEVLKPEVLSELFGKDNNRPVFTKVRNSAPTRFAGEGSAVGSLIADGCTVEGTVKNSILFRGVHIAPGAVVENCILLQDTSVGVNCQLHCVVTDKNAVISDNRSLSGCETLPYFIGKDRRI